MQNYLRLVPHFYKENIHENTSLYIEHVYINMKTKIEFI